MNESSEQTLFQRFCSLDAMYDSSYRICQNIRWKDSTIDLEENRLKSILRLDKEIKNLEYEQMIFSCFTIIERGKKRDIRACHIRDRLMQNTLCNEVLIPELTPRFVNDNCATLKNKGIDFALQRARHHLQNAHKEYGFGKPFYALRIDIKKYFDSIDHAALKTLVRKYIKDDDIIYLVDYIIDTFCFKLTKDQKPLHNKKYYIVKNCKYTYVNVKTFRPKEHYYEYSNKSLGLGSQASQLLALLALNEIDHFIKEKLHIAYYGRYMDDIYLLHNDKQYLFTCLSHIKQELAKIGLSVNEKKSHITKITPLEKDSPLKGSTAFKYLKWNFYLTKTNKLIQVPFKEKIIKEKAKLRKMQKLWLAGRLSFNDIVESYQGFRAHINKGTTHNLIKDLDNYFYLLFKGVEL